MKKVILIIALLLPIGVFVFLRFFGKNEFSIPVYYENGVDSPPIGCNRDYNSSYQVSDSLLTHLGWQGSSVLIIADSSHAVQLGLKRLNEELKDEVQTIYPRREVAFLDEFYTCELLLQMPWTTVLLDDQRRIRGYYDPQSREEVDRLIVELKILLKKY